MHILYFLCTRERERYEKNYPCVLFVVRGENYKSRWFAYAKMNFLDGRRGTMSDEEESNVRFAVLKNDNISNIIIITTLF